MGIGKSSGLTLAIVAGLAIAIFHSCSSRAEMAVLNPSSQYPEGPTIAFGGILYAEMGADRVMFSNRARTSVVWEAPGCGPTSVARHALGLMVLCHRAGGLAFLTPDGSKLTAFVDRDGEGRPIVTPNASVADGKGGAYLSSSGLFAPGAASTGAVLHVTGEGEVRRVADGIHYANGVAVSPDGGRLYVSEHLSRNVLVYDIADDGSLAEQRLFVKLDDLSGPGERNWDVGPDGLAVDEAGNLYIAEYGGGRLYVASPAGERLAEIEVPELYVTAPVISPDQATIFLTAPAARDPRQPGKVYAVDNPVVAAD